MAVLLVVLSDSSHWMFNLLLVHAKLMRIGIAIIGESPDAASS
jgi:hypothetical protein